MQWKYKAFDNSMQTHEGLINGGSVEEIAMLLRQSGLQLIELTTANDFDSSYHRKIDKFKKFRNSYKIRDYQKRNPKQLKISWFKKIKELFKRRRNF